MLNGTAVKQGKANEDNLFLQDYCLNFLVDTRRCA